MTTQRRMRRIDFLMLPIVSVLVIFGLWIEYNRMAGYRQVAKVAVRFANKSGLLKRQLGSPIKMGYFVSGWVIGGDEGGTADLIIPVSGPNGSGELLDWSQSGFAGWHVCSLVFRPKTGPDVVIAPDEKAHCERE